jgi:hypothetical protein
VPAFLVLPVLVGLRHPLKRDARAPVDATSTGARRTPAAAATAAA